MTKLLTICIPTYKRSETLRRCIDSIVAQIDKYGLADYVDIYVTNDASPDDTISVLHAYESLSYFKGVTREKNLGMNLNIKCMLNEVAKKSDYQLIITDDDFLQPDVMGEMVEFLRTQQNDPNRVSAIWTPRYSYTEDGQLHTVVCGRLGHTTLVRPSAINSGRHMFDGFVLSGLIVRAENIDFDFWELYKENAYFPMIFFGDVLYRGGAYYWHKNLVHHTVLNKCHWESWGRNDLYIGLKKFADFMNTYDIMSRKFNKSTETIGFYYAAFQTIQRTLERFMHSDELKCEKAQVLAAIHDLKVGGIIKFKPPLSWLMVYAFIRSSILGIFKLTVLRMILLVPGKENNSGYYKDRAEAYLAFLRAIPLMFKVIK